MSIYVSCTMLKHDIEVVAQILGGHCLMDHGGTPVVASTSIIPASRIMKNGVFLIQA